MTGVGSLVAGSHDVLQDEEVKSLVAVKEEKMAPHEPQGSRPCGPKREKAWSLYVCRRGTGKKGFPPGAEESRFN